MYRALTLLAFERGVPSDAAGQLTHLLAEADIRLSAANHNGNRVFLNGADVTEAIRSPEVTERVSGVAAHKAVREEMVARQQALARSGGVVMDGRDIGTVVLPQADLKVFLTADAQTRAFRRWQELRAEGHVTDLASVLRSLEVRDRQDTERAESPLRRADDAIGLDTTSKQIDEVVDEIVAMVERRLSGCSTT